MENKKFDKSINSTDLPATSDEVDFERIRARVAQAEAERDHFRTQLRGAQERGLEAELRAEKAESLMTNDIPEKRFIALIDEKLEQVLKQPEGWGGLEALEPIALVLLMLRNRVTNPAASESDVIKDYKRFLAERTAPGTGALLTRLGDDPSLERMIKILRERVEYVQTRTEPQPEPDEYMRPELVAYEGGARERDAEVAKLKKELALVYSDLDRALAFDEQSLFDEYKRLLSENGKLLRERNLAREEQANLQKALNIAQLLLDEDEEKRHMEKND